MTDRARPVPTWVAREYRRTTHTKSCRTYWSMLLYPSDSRCRSRKHVLILIVLEYALLQIPICSVSTSTSLNPYCIGTRFTGGAVSELPQLPSLSLLYWSMLFYSLPTHKQRPMRCLNPYCIGVCSSTIRDGARETKDLS